MLLLQLRLGQALLIGDAIEVRVTKIERGRVELGITAPRTVKVLREGVVDRDLKKELGEHE